MHKLNLPGFGYSNWQSRIRDLVNVVEEHRHLGPWPGKDKDFVVRDESGKLEQWLRDESYNDFPAFDELDGSSSVAGSTIEYLIEIGRAHV